MKYDEHAHLWTLASVKLLDVRFASVRDGDKPPVYRLPANSFLFTMRGAAHIKLDQTEYTVNGMFALHGGKGMLLDIHPETDRFEYYLLLYKAYITAADNLHIHNMNKALQPFQVQYGFIPAFPLALYNKLELLAQQWSISGSMEKLHAKSLFYQFVYELHRQLREQTVKLIPADPAEQALQYLHEHYTESITLDMLASMLDCSASHLSRLFKQKVECSPIEYMIRLRIGRARHLLVHTNAALQDIAASIGYVDVYYFSRIFKKHTGLSPLKYRDRESSPYHAVKQHNPFLMLRSSIVPPRLKRYIKARSDNDYHHKSKGDFQLVRNRKSSAALTLLVCLTLLLSACSSGTAAGNRVADNNGAAVNSAVSSNDGTSQNSQAGTVTVMYTGADGEVEVPRNPERIVVLTHAYVGYFMALGINPVGVPSMTMDNPYYEGKLDGMEDIGAWGAFSLEKIMSLNPDLIVALANTDNLDEIKKIAPVVTVNYGERNYKEQLIEFGKLTNRAETAEQWVAGWEAKIAEAKPKVLEAVGDRTVSVLSPYNKGVYVYGEGFGRGTEILYDEFGLKAPAAFDIKLHSADISLEKIDEFAGDYIFATPDTSESENTSPAYESVIWRGLPAVQANRVFYMDKDSAAFNDPATLEAMLPFIVESLTSGGQ
jgi:iron complex transport system substrate-binding protein